MSCDYYLDATGYTKIVWRCYDCGGEIDPISAYSVTRHKKCSIERNGKWVIPVVMEIPSGFLERV